MGELQALFKWLLMVFLLAVLMRPYLRIKNLKLWDDGFSISFGLGTAISFFFSFILSALKIIKFDTAGIYISTIIIIILGIFISTKSVKNKITLSTKFVYGFLLFALIFLLGVYIKGFNPNITSVTEQYMDYGFVNTIYRQKNVFPEDIWYLGEKLNYYYLGQAATAFLCRLSFVLPKFGYPFMLYTIEASLFTMVFALVSAMIQGKKLSRILGGLSASFMACFAGNGHYIYYGIIVPIIENITGNMSLRYADYGYYFPDSTTYIGYNQVIPDYGKHEYPAYSFILGDLHAHVINLLFVIPLLALLIDYAYDESTVRVNETAGLSRYKALIYEFFDFRLIAISALFALFMGSNYWDFPIYFVICGGVILFTDFHKNGISISTFIHVLIKGGVMLVIAFLLAAPFNLHFTKMASEIHFCENHSPLYKMLILWFIPVFICVSYLISLIRKYCTKLQNDQKESSGTVFIMLALVPCAIGLILLPEIIYVKDIYGEAYARFNTMFKLTYQAFLLTAIVIGMAVGYRIENRNTCRGVILLLTVLLLSTYSVTGIRQFMGNIFDFSSRTSSDCTAYIDEDITLDVQKNIIDIINSDQRDLIHILEASGVSYQPDNMISVFTGAPTYVGWGVHEWMWRSGWDPIGMRQGEVSYFYNSGNIDYCSQFVKDNKIDYIVVGPREYYYYEINLNGFENLQNIRLIYESDDNFYRLYKVDTEM